MAPTNLGDKREKDVCTHPFACLSVNSKGRAETVVGDGIRSEFQRDVHRIIYSLPFRRLRHKTQVFYKPNNDHICNRLEHSLLVSNAARTVARALGLNEDLAEAIGLGHDLGHAPFGHHGEKILSELCEENGIGRPFQHEINGLRCVDRLGQFDRGDNPGLNLTFEVRDGIISHCGEDNSVNVLVPYQGEKDLSSYTLRKQVPMPVSLEGCIVRLVDKVAYLGRDLEDALQAGIIQESDVPKVIIEELGARNSQIVKTLLVDIIDESPNDCQKIRMSDARFQALKQLMDFNYKYIYLTPKVEGEKQRARSALRCVFHALLDVINRSNRFRDKGLLPEGSVFRFFEKFVQEMKYPEEEAEPQIVVDYVSGFTDNFLIAAIKEVVDPVNLVVNPTA
ncbi:MAG TPA: HD domain-containing protein [candidate division Zixibacteria bacterium]|nr:HD domain-containing protein [candidate division Zixibacteria bacterium]